MQYNRKNVFLPLWSSWIQKTDTVFTFKLYFLSFKCTFFEKLTSLLDHAILNPVLVMLLWFFSLVFFACYANKSCGTLWWYLNIKCQHTVNKTGVITTFPDLLLFCMFVALKCLDYQTNVNIKDSTNKHKMHVCYREIIAYNYSLAWITAIIAKQRQNKCSCW